MDILKFIRLANLKDLVWLVILAGLFCSFTYWIFNVPVVVAILVVFGIKLGWAIWSCADKWMEFCRKNGGLELATEDEYPALMGTIRRCCRSANLPPPPVYIWDNPELNAFATGRSPNKSIIVVNRGLVINTTPTELKGIISHEVAHIVNRDCLNQAICGIFCEALEFQAKMFTWVGTFLLSFLFVKETARRSRKKQEIHIIWVLLILLFGIPILTLGLIAHVISFLSHLILKNLSRTRELRADVIGARLSRDPIALADALEKIEFEAVSMRQGSSLAPLAVRQLSIVNPVTEIQVDESLWGGVVAKIARNLQSTHPTIEERVMRLRALDPHGPRS